VVIFYRAKKSVEIPGCFEAQEKVH